MWLSYPLATGGIQGGSVLPREKRFFRVLHLMGSRVLLQIELDFLCFQRYRIFADMYFSFAVSNVECS